MRVCEKTVANLDAIEIIAKAMCDVACWEDMPEWCHDQYDPMVSIKLVHALDHLRGRRKGA